jgi:anti-anti-sigma factor
VRAPAFEAAVTTGGGTQTVALTGELDLTTVDRVEAAVGTPAPGTRCVLDLRGLGFMDSSAIRLFMRLDIRARDEGWTLVLVHAGGMTARVIELCRLHERIEVHEQ